MPYKITASIRVDRATTIVEDCKSLHFGQVIFRANSLYNPDKKLVLSINT